jgi:peptide chain release factor 1
MNPEDQVSFELDMNSINKQYTRSRGKGGQNVNKVSSCVRLLHVPTGIQVRCEESRDQGKNEVLAYKLMAEKLKSIADAEHDTKIRNRRNDQIGESGRGTRKRTYRITDGIVADHTTNKQCRWKDIQKGRIDLLS